MRLNYIAELYRLNEANRMSPFLLNSLIDLRLNCIGWLIPDRRQHIVAIGYRWSAGGRPVVDRWLAGGRPVETFGGRWGRWSA